MARERTSFGGARLGRTRKNRAGGRSGGRSIGFRGFAFSRQTKGLNSLERRLHTMMRVGDVDAVLQTTPTSGVFVGYAAKSELQSRSAWDNARLWNTHRAEGRNPFVYDSSAGNSHWKTGANGVISGRAGAMVTAAKRVAEFMLRSVEGNIASGKGMKPLATKYEKWKSKYYYGKPILMLTGQLVKSLKPRVIEVK